ncbi:MAG: ABC transporter permease subunit [Bacteroidota bacterium]
MKQIWTIAKRELSEFYNSLIAYILLIAFLGFTGFFTWLSGNGDIFFRKQADLQVFFSIANLTLFFFIPSITMKLLAEEKKVGTLELLLTKPVSDLQLVIGKYLAGLLMIVTALLLTIPYYVTVSTLGNFDHGASIAGYFGLILMSSAYIGIGLFASSISKNQIAAFIVALLIGVCFHFLFDIVSHSNSGLIAEIFDTLSLSNHFDSISRGVIDTKDLIYFLSVTFFALILAQFMVSKRN